LKPDLKAASTRLQDAAANGVLSKSARNTAEKKDAEKKEQATKVRHPTPAPSSCPLLYSTHNFHLMAEKA
jgi:hypothetical protein